MPRRALLPVVVLTRDGGRARGLLAEASLRFVDVAVSVFHQLVDEILVLIHRLSERLVLVAGRVVLGFRVGAGRGVRPGLVLVGSGVVAHRVILLPRAACGNVPFISRVRANRAMHERPVRNARSAPNAAATVPRPSSMSRRPRAASRPRAA